MDILSNRLILLGLACVLALGSGIAAHAQSAPDGTSGDDAGSAFRQRPFPAWMNETPSRESSPVPPGKSAALSIADPVDPIDPDSSADQAASKGTTANGRITFTPPRMPDFSRFRQKAVRTTPESNVGTATQKIGQASTTPLLALPASLSQALASLTMPAAAASADASPQPENAGRFYRPTGYTSFMRESLKTKAAEDTEAGSRSGQ